MALCFGSKNAVFQLVVIAVFAVIPACIAFIPLKDFPDMSKFPTTVNASVLYDPAQQIFSFKMGIVPDDAVAWANFTITTNITGWAHLTVTTNGTYNDSIQAYAAGLVEGHLTSPYMYMHWMNTINEFCKSMSAYCTKLQTFLETNLQWMKEQINANPTDPYFHQMDLLLIQLTGLEDGFWDRPDKPRIDFDPFGFLLFQIGGDLEDLESALNQGGKERMMGDGHCSALIKLLPGNKDLYVAHDTWTVYETMLRILKKYDFAFHLTNTSSEVVPGRNIAFSSSPGMLLSGDDFYIANSGLVTMETTIGNSNNELWKYVQPTGQALEWVRNIIANRLAMNGSHWAEIFVKYNSGTYNNQWMVVDYNKFTPGQPLSEGLLVIVEQIPGTVHYDDMTDFLSHQNYWPSYNVPFFKDIYDLSGWPPLEKKYGDWFSYNKTARANIFRRDNVKVTDLDSMIKLMRYNDFQHDPLSACKCKPPYSGENAISARSDLNDKSGTYPFSALGHRNHGGTDMKVTTSSMAETLSFVAVCGPTHDQQPPFQWSKSDFNQTLHMGQPDLFDFEPITVNWAN